MSNDNEAVSNTSGTATPPAKADLAMLERLVALINKARAERGSAQGAVGAGASQALPALRPSARLTQAAQEHSADMSQNQYLGYTPPEGGEGLAQRVKRVGYLGRVSYNIARNQPTAEAVLELWLSDDATRAAIFDFEHREIGLGFCNGYFTAAIGSPESVISDPLRDHFCELINAERARVDLPHVELNRLLNYTAQTHCLDMAKRDFPEHGQSDGKDVSERAKDAGFDSVVCELVGKALTPEEQVEAWMNDGPFRAKLLNARYRLIGVGLFAGKWVLVMGAVLPPAGPTPTVTAAVTTAAWAATAATATAAGAATSGPEPAPSATPPAETAISPAKSSGDLKSDLENLINKQRTDAKLPPLQPNSALQQIVEGHAADMVEKNFLAYEHPGCIGIPGRVKASSYRGRIFPAITKGQGNAEAVVRLFMNSEGHRKNLLDPEFRDFGVAAKDGAFVIMLGAPLPEANPDLRATLLGLINAQRAASSAPPLALSSLLNSVAQDYAQDMVRRDFFGFNNPEGKGPDVLAKHDGFPGTVVPSIARGATTPETTLAAWMKNPGNRMNILDAKFALVGIGVAESRWVLLLGTASA